AETGFPVAAYELYVDGGATAAVTTTTNIWMLTGLEPSSTHSVQLDYLASDGRRSPLSPAASGTTWSGANFGGITFEWMIAQFGADVLSWSKPTDDSDGDGANNLQEFRAGTAPTDPDSVMRVQLVSTAQGTRLSWNGQPGFFYQVQLSEGLSAGSWTNFGLPRFAAGTTDSILVNGTKRSEYYRIIRLR